MELVRHLHNLRSRHQGCVATIGNFDGVHLGHEAVIRQLTRYARDIGLPATVMIFEPQPREYFDPGSAPVRLTVFREKLEALQHMTVDRVVCLRFGAAIARLSARQFVEDLLVGSLGVERVVVGDDFRFGQGREGDFQLLNEMGRIRGFEAVSTETFRVEGERVSSGRIREALAMGDLERAHALLGRNYSISGRVIGGDGRGRELGFPTANVDLNRRKSPLWGIFAVRVAGPDAENSPGVASIGTRPVFNGKRLLLEVHLFDFDDSLYGRRIRVEFLHKLRDERNFASVEELKEQIRQDVETAREYFQRRGEA